jgi:aspartyl-tRNA(Asn)/glutamyl-tRNA(Gln) amidotransferase subunit C
MVGKAGENTRKTPSRTLLLGFRQLKVFGGITAAFAGVNGIETLSDGTGLAVAMSESAVDPEEVAHVADLARVDLADDELEAFAEQFADILAYFETLDEVPEVESEPDLTNVMRADEVEASLSQAEALENAPDAEDGFFKGPRVS